MDFDHPRHLRNRLLPNRYPIRAVAVSAIVLPYVREKYFIMVHFQKDLFENVDNRIIISYDKRTRLYNQLPSFCFRSIALDFTFFYRLLVIF